jgi:hypothetical protein
MTPLLLQTLGPRVRLGGIHDRFAGGGSSPGDMGMVLLLAAAFITFLYVLYCLQRRLSRREIDNSGKLFRTLILDLGLSPVERSLLMNVARDGRLAEPTILLLGPGPFWRYVRPWLEGRPRRRRPKPEVVDRLVTRLFGHPPAVDDPAGPA